MLKLAPRFGAWQSVKLAVILLLVSTALTALYSSVSGFVQDVAFVEGKKSEMPPLRGFFETYSRFVPAGTSFGFFAPQVASSFRFSISLASAKTGKVMMVENVPLSPESRLLTDTLVEAAQNKMSAQTVGACLASRAFSENPDYRAAQVLWQAQSLPALSDKELQPAHWETLATFYFTR